MWSWLKKIKKSNYSEKVLICIYTYPGSDMFNYYKTEQFYKKIPEKYDVILVYGHDGETVLDNNCLKLNHKEDYKLLPDKTLKMFKYLSQYEYKGFIKYDDDNKLLDPSIFDDVVKGDYSGYAHRHNPGYYQRWCQQKEIFRPLRNINTNFYFGGPLYYISNKFSKIIQKESDDITDYIWAEDVLIGEIYMKNKDKLELNCCKGTRKIMIEGMLGNYHYLAPQSHACIPSTFQIKE